MAAILAACRPPWAGGGGGAGAGFEYEVEDGGVEGHGEAVGGDVLRVVVQDRVGLQGRRGDLASDEVDGMTGSPVK
jgi:hypothetical protein